MITCLPSQTVGYFKGLVTKSLGVPADTILLRKRPGEDYLKDDITLKEYGIEDKSTIFFGIAKGE